MKLIFAVFYLIAFSTQSVCAQVITSQELSKISGDINAIQIAADGKELIDPANNKTSIISFPKESFNVFFSSGFAYQAVYKNSGTDQLFLTENIDFSVAKKVTVLPGSSKSSVQCIRVSFPETVVTYVLENGKELSTINKNEIDFYCTNDNTGSKNKLKMLLETLIDKLAKERTKYHALTNGKLYLPDGIYEGGYTAGNRRTSEGTMEYTNEPLYKGVWVYKGYWENDRRHLDGTLTSKPNKKANVALSENLPVEIYGGKWVNDVLQGTGTYEKVGHWTYKGDFVNGKMEGVGTSVYKNGSKYNGQWKNGLREGKGILTGSTGEVYDGEWKNDELNGEGTWVSGSGIYKYVGGFRNGKWDGKGVLKDGANTYDGEWKRGDQSGKGEYIWANGDKYIGEWSVSRNGKGIMLFANGDKYDGEWRSDKKHMQGTYTWSNGNTYTGEWIKDTMERLGTMTYATGARYVGEWRMGKPYGIGTYYNKENKIISNIGLDKPVLNSTYLRKKTEVLNRDKTYFVNYLLTDSAFILYVPKNVSHTIYFDMQNDKKITPGVDLKYIYVNNSIVNYYDRLFIKSTSYYERYIGLPDRRDTNNIFELTFELKNIVNLRRTVGIVNPKEIAFQISFSDGDKDVYLPKRKEELDFSEGNMYYIKVK